MTVVQKYEALISDFDGVLWLYSEKINQDAIMATMKAHGYILTEAEINGILGRPSGDVIPELLITRGNFDERYHALVVNENKGRYDELWNWEVSLDPIIGKTLRALHEQNIPIAIATTNRRKVIERFLNRFNLRDTISLIVSGENVTRKKPDPEVYTRAWRELGKKRSLAVEDMPIGVRSARAAGLHCAVIPTQSSAHLDFGEVEPTYTLGSFSELLDYF